MGTKFVLLGPSYACLFMGYFEEQLLEEYNGPTPYVYLKYIDDIFGITTMPEASLMNFIKFANEFHPSIELIYNFGKKVNFLDCTLEVQQTKVSSTVFLQRYRFSFISNIHVITS